MGYIEEPEIKKLKVIDCFSNDFFNEECANKIEEKYILKGWETAYKYSGKLGMVKYED